jgi:hypothetical protein
MKLTSFPKRIELEYLVAVWLGTVMTEMRAWHPSVNPLHLQRKRSTRIFDLSEAIK